MTYEEWVKSVERGVTINPEMAFAAGAASRDAEIAELVAALEDNWNCNPCETTRQQKAFDAAQSILAKVRKP